MTDESTDNLFLYSFLAIDSSFLAIDGLADGTAETVENALIAITN